jgi:hypothetical protein
MNMLVPGWLPAACYIEHLILVAAWTASPSVLQPLIKMDNKSFQFGRRSAGILCVAKF